MKQFEYLNELKENLEGRLSPEAIKDILSDYESFFISGREEGKTDDEISKGLGSPAFLAKSLIEAQEETKAPDMCIANPFSRFCAYLIDAATAVFPAFVLACILGIVILPILLFIEYPSPLAGSLNYVSYSAYKEYSVAESPKPIIVNVTVDGKEVTQPPEDGQKSTQKDSAGPTPVTIVFALLVLLFYMFYSLAASLILKGQTIGKRIMRIRVCRSDTGLVTKDRILSRELLGKILVNSIPIIPLISIFTILFTREHKALHDMISDTIVVEV